MYWSLFRSHVVFLKANCQSDLIFGSRSIAQRLLIELVIVCFFEAIIFFIDSGFSGKTPLSLQRLNVCDNWEENRVFVFHNNFKLEITFLSGFFGITFFYRFLSLLVTCSKKNCFCILAFSLILKILGSFLYFSVAAKIGSSY